MAFESLVVLLTLIGMLDTLVTDVVCSVMILFTAMVVLLCFDVIGSGRNAGRLQQQRNDCGGVALFGRREAVANYRFATAGQKNLAPRETCCRVGRFAAFYSVNRAFRASSF